MDTCTWLRLLPMDIQSVTERLTPQQPVGSEETVIGTLPDELINLYSLWTATAKEGARTLVDLRYSVDDEDLMSRYDELTDKAAALESLFWIAVKEHLQIWGIGVKEAIGLRQEYQVVKHPRTANLPPFLRGLLGGSM